MKEIRRILQHYNQRKTSPSKYALATVVNVEESSYRRIGARMLVSADGNWIGGISGGCLEGDALKKAQFAIIKNQASVVIYDTLNDDDYQIGVGLGCNGKIEVLMTPIHDEGNHTLDILDQIKDDRDPNIMISIIESEVSDLPLGKSFIYDFDKLSEHNLGFASATISSEIESIKQKRRSKVVSLKTPSDQSIRILIEYFEPEIHAVIAGDNYDINTFTQMASEMGWRISLIGKLKKLQKQTAALAEKVYDFAEADKVKIDAHSVVLLMSHDYDKDVQLMSVFHPQNPKYIGMLGPRKRAIKIKEELAEEGIIVDLEAANIHAPIGLNIGANSPEEIAISIISEIVQKFRSGDGKSLKYKEGTIHPRED